MGKKKKTHKKNIRIGDIVHWYYAKKNSDRQLISGKVITIYVIRDSKNTRIVEESQGRTCIIFVDIGNKAGVVIRDNEIRYVEEIPYLYYAMIERTKIISNAILNNEELREMWAEYRLELIMQKYNKQLQDVNKQKEIQKNLELRNNS